MAKKPSDLVKEIWAASQKLLRSLGYSNEDNFFTNRLMFSSFIIFLVFIGMILNSFFRYLPDIPNAVRTLLVTPLLFACLSRLINLLFKDAAKIYEEQTKVLDEFFETSEVDFRFREVLMKHLNTLTYGTYSYFSALFLINHFPVITSWILSYYYSDYIYFTPVYLPFTDPQALSGFLINQSIMAWSSFLTYISLSLTDYGQFILFVMTISMTDINILKLRDLGIELKDLNLREEIDEKDRIEIEKKFIEFIKKFQIYSDYVDRLQDYSETYSFVVISSNSFGIGLAFFSSLTYSISLGIAFILGFLTQVGLVCVEGAIITHQKKKILKELCDFPWYEMTPKMRKIYLQFVHCCQYSPEMELPIFGVINMEVFTNVINGSYSLYNFFLNFRN